MKKIAILTSGGDAPGMNTAIRGVVREAGFNDISVYAVYDGYKGLVEGHIMPLTNRDIGGTLQLGGTILGTARYPQFQEKPYLRKAFANLEERDIEALVVIGGNGSLAGAHALYQETGLPVVGIPASIDNDLYGTDMALGVDTALNTIVYNIDKIRDTASSHGRLFLVEVMGRDCGYLALTSAIACGALAVLTPELQDEFDPALFCNIIYQAFRRSKKHAIIIKAEGFKVKSDEELHQLLADYLHNHGIDQLSIRSTKFGHIQRGGSPTAFDRILGNKLGVHAVRQLVQGNKDIMVGLKQNTIHACALSEITQSCSNRIRQLYDDYLKQEIMMTQKLTPS